MKNYTQILIATILTVSVLAFSGCATSGGKAEAQKFDDPPETASGPDKQLYSKALKAQKEGRLEAAVDLWKDFLSKHPNSHEAHNNLGMVYYAQDMVTQALQEFETAYRLHPIDPRIRKNLARALEFKAAMYHENREYYKTLEILDRLEKIVPPEERQTVLFKKEQVEDQIYIQVTKTDDIQAYRDFIHRFPDGLNAVRAREYLEKRGVNPSQVASKKKRKFKSGKKSESKKPGTVKSWISAGKKVDPKTQSSEKAGQFSATYTPPSSQSKAGKKDSKKEVDIFGLDPSPEEKDIEEENIQASQTQQEPVTIPDEDLGKPERIGGKTSEDPESGKDHRSTTAAGEDPGRKTSDTVTAGLDTQPDLAPDQAETLPAETETLETSGEPAGDIQIKKEEPQSQTAEATPAVKDQGLEAQEEAPGQPEPEPEALGSASDKKDQPGPEQAQPAETAEADSQETATGESTEDEESERMARIIQEEIAKEEAAKKNAAQTESAPTVESAEMQTEEVESPAEKAMEVASIVQKDKGAQDGQAPAVSETPEPAQDAPPKEDDAELTPSPEEQAVPAPQDPSTITMVVIKVDEGSTLNVRAEPSAKGEILGYLESGDMMPFVSESGDWYEIGIEEKLTGWVHKKFSVTQDVPIESAGLDLTDETAGSGEAGTGSTEPFPDSGAGEVQMVVVQVREGATLNVRSEPSSEGMVIDMLVRGDLVPLIEEKDGWYHVKVSDEQTGWISQKFSAIQDAGDVPPEMAATSAPPEALPEEETAAPPASKTPVTTVVVIQVSEGSTLNVRSEPSAQGKVMARLKSGDVRPLVKESGDWYQVELPNGQAGWVSSKYSGKMDVTSNVIPNP